MAFSSLPLGAPLIAFGISALLVWGLSKYGVVLDYPNHRSLHVAPVPRTGGIGVLIGIFITWLLFPTGLLNIILAACALMMLSVYDDFRGLSASLRLVIHIFVVAIFFTFSEDGANFPLLVIVVLLTVWMINLYNFMDGSDGLAAGMAVIGFSFFAFSLREYAPYGWASGSIAAAALGFLVFNFHPAKIFLGDSGSIPLGFLAAAFGYIGWTRSAWPWWYPVFVFSPFIVDASLTLLKRALRRERIWEAHKQHYYQRLIRMGWGHKKTALAGYGLMLFIGFLATIALTAAASAQKIFFLIVAILYLVVALRIDTKWASYVANNRDLK